MEKQHLSLPKGLKCIISTAGRKYRKDCPPDKKTGRKFKTGEKPWKNQVHHILCDHAIKDFTGVDADTFEYVRNCLMAAVWDINDSKNLVGLPLKETYFNSHGKSPQDLPCHDVDHNTTKGYTDEVKTWLHTNVWNKLRAKKKVHDVDVKKIVKQLDDCTVHFKRVLAGRGGRNKGTAISYEKRFEESQKSKWYKPFSMAKEPNRRSPGGRYRLPFLDMMIR